MIAIPAISWGTLGYRLGRRRARRRMDLRTRSAIVEYYVAAGIYATRHPTGDANARLNGSIVPPTAPRRTAGTRREDAVEFPEDLRYTKDHEWARAEAQAVRVGITDFAQDALGDVVYVDLPEVGRRR